MDEDKRLPEQEDDGRTIAPMNVEGMPWYTPNPDQQRTELEQRRRSKMTEEETRAYTWAAIRAGLLVMLVFAVVFFLFLLFCDYVWFR